MTTPLQERSPEYAGLLRHSNELASRYGVDMTQAEYEEMLVIDAQLTEIELEYNRAVEGNHERN